MKWAFWRRRKPRATGQGRTDARQSGPADSALEEGGARADQAAQMRVRMRRRLIGAAALLVGTAVIVPMMLDPAPRPLPDGIPIEIPSERTPFSPRLTLPASAADGASAGKPAGAANGPPAGLAVGVISGAAAGSPAEAPSGAKAGGPEQVDEPPKPAGGEAAQSVSAPAGSPVEGPSGAKAGRWIVQAAALSSESAARQLSERLSKAGMAAFVERTGSGGAVLYRVRVGPFDSREAAARTRKSLHAMGVGSNVVRLEQGGR